MLILIAEDDELILKTIEHKLLKEGHEVILTRNGKDAIETLKTREFKNTPGVKTRSILYNKYFKY